jgi:hypothetical protein
MIPRLSIVHVVPQIAQVFADSQPAIDNQLFTAEDAEDRKGNMEPPMDADSDSVIPAQGPPST